MPGNEGAEATEVVLVDALGEMSSRFVAIAERLKVFAADPFHLAEELDVEERSTVDALLPDLRGMHSQLGKVVLAAAHRLDSSRQAVFGLQENGIRSSSRSRLWGHRSRSKGHHRVQAVQVEADLQRLSVLLDAISTQQTDLTQTFQASEAVFEVLLPKITGSNRQEWPQIKRALVRHDVYQDFLDAVREHLAHLNHAAHRLRLIAQEFILLRAALQEAGPVELPDHKLFKTWMERASRGMLSASSLARRRTSFG